MSEMKIVADNPFTGPQPDPSELRALAAAIVAGEPGWRDRVDALPPNVLMRKTLESAPEVIAEHLRGVAVYIERRLSDAPFGKKAGQPFYESWLAEGAPDGTAAAAP